jgi:hypothetical protein
MDLNHRVRGTGNSEGQGQALCGGVGVQEDIGRVVPVLDPAQKTVLVVLYSGQDIVGGAAVLSFTASWCM